ncbi:uncharacterized protein A4U43_C09F12160 [Asparagus officinalis]|uniref:Uncharacterized protein n=1 Tax=Asparagus officinalis TaxID=4686 RepID=A0A5P1E780_ASPOF|nr:uncharacterized protein A4U43_C09F12160 [Asparagus officinalis]
MAPRMKASDAKRARTDASPSVLSPDRDSEPKPSDSVQAQLEELENAMKRVISLVDQDRGTFVELKRSLSDRAAHLRCQGDFMLALHCLMRLINMELLLTKLEDLQHADLESEVKLFLAPARHRTTWQKEC